MTSDPLKPQLLCLCRSFVTGCCDLALTFSLSRHQAKKKVAKNQFADLQSLTRSKNDVLAHNSLSAEAKKALEYGISMGGARPKSSVQDGTALYLVKFNKADDLHV